MPDRALTMEQSRADVTKRLQSVPLEQRITVRIDTFCQMTGIGQTQVREMIKDSTLDSFLIGKRLRLIVLESYWRYVEERLGKPLAYTAANHGVGKG